VEIKTVAATHHTPHAVYCNLKRYLLYTNLIHSILFYFFVLHYSILLCSTLITSYSPYTQIHRALTSRSYETPILFSFYHTHQIDTVHIIKNTSSPSLSSQIPYNTIFILLFYQCPLHSPSLCAALTLKDSD
jgi:hypothetical protein